MTRHLFRLQANPDTTRPVINMSQISFDGGSAGLLFAVGTVLVFLVGIPSLIWFSLAALALGLVMSMLFRLHR